ncbi:MAG: phage tail protein [Saprospiraceae bacterium]|nr:phage tail protein [Saprospiraceae bacterium]
MEPFIGQIQAFGFNFAPRGWATCDGQLLSIAQYQALFSLLGTTYGGNGTTNFALPDFRGRVMMHQGAGPGLTPRSMGERGGVETNTLSAGNLPAHSHPVAIPVSTGNANSEEPAGNVLAATNNNQYAAAPTAGVSYHPFSTGNAGSSIPVNNVQPYLVVNVCIALEGIYPSRP